MATYDGRIDVVPTSDGRGWKLVGSANGLFDGSQGLEIIQTLVSNDASLERWSLWIPGFQPDSTLVSPNTLATKAKNKTVAVVAVRRRGKFGVFTVPVLKIGDERPERKRLEPAAKPAKPARLTPRAK